MIVAKLVLFWFVMVACAVLNGILREKALNRYLGEKTALLLSGLFLSLFVFLVSYVAVDYFAYETVTVYVSAGIFWVFLTLIFEYGLGHFVQGKPWSEINKVFDVQHGNLFLLVLLVTMFAPLLSAFIKGYL